MSERILGEPGPTRRRRLKLLPLLLCLAGLLLFLVGQAGAFDPNPSDPDVGAYALTVDENGPNDVPGQKDLTLHGIDESGLPNNLRVLWDWDETSISGANTLDACVLLDSDGDIYANFALCLTLGNQPLQKLATTLYSCGDTRVDRCASQIAVVSLPASPATACEFAVTNNTDPFLGNGKAGGADKPKDTRAKCTLNLPEIASATNTTVSDLNLINTCSYPSQQPNSDPSDCVLIPRDATLVIAKSAGGDTTTVFPFTVTGGGTFSGNIGAGTVLADRTVGIVSGVDTAVAETVASLPAGWEFVSSSCTGSTLTGGNGTSGSGISSVTVKAATGNTITCTFTNVLRSPGVLTILKSCPNGAAASTDRFQARDTKGTAATGDDVNAGSVLACGGGAGGTTTYTPAVATGYAITEAAGSTTPATDLGNYVTTYSADCTDTDGLGRGEDKTCTITNTLKSPGVLTIVKSCPSGAAASTDRFQARDTKGTAATADDVNAGSLLACGGGAGGTTTYTPAVATGYDITEAAGTTSPATDLGNYVTTYSADCTDTDGLARAENKTCTITNTLKSPGVLTIVKSCTNGAPFAASDRFQARDTKGTAATDDDVNAGSLLACGGGAGGTTTYTPAVATGYDITEAAGTTSPATDLGNYVTTYSADCTDTDGLARAENKTCTITNKLRTFTIVTYVCETTSGTPVLYKSTVTLPSGQNSQTTATTVVTGSTVAAMCGVAANHTGLSVGNYDPHVVIGTSPAP